VYLNTVCTSLCTCLYIQSTHICRLYIYLQWQFVNVSTYYYRLSFLVEAYFTQHYKLFYIDYGRRWGPSSLYYRPTDHGRCYSSNTGLAVFSLPTGRTPRNRRGSLWSSCHFDSNAFEITATSRLCCSVMTGRANEIAFCRPCTTYTHRWTSPVPTHARRLDRKPRRGWRILNRHRFGKFPA